MTPANSLNILALDGGGVRGYLTIEILRALAERSDVKATDEEATRKKQQELARNFNVISGTSTGQFITLTPSDKHTITSNLAAGRR